MLQALTLFRKLLSRPPLLKHQLHRVQIGRVNGLNIVAGIKIVNALMPGKQRHDHIGHLFAHRQFNHLQINLVTIVQNRADPLLEPLILLGCQGATDQRGFHNTFLDHHLAKALLEAGGGGTHHQSVTKLQHRLTPLTFKGKDAGPATYRDDLEDVIKPQLFKFSTQGTAHGATFS